MTTDDNAKLAKTSKFYQRCEVCDYNANRKFNFLLHLQTKKHIDNTNNAANNANTKQIASLTSKTSNTHVCIICQRTFNDRAGLWRHKKKCTITSPTDDKIQVSPPTPHTTSQAAPFAITEELVISLIKQNTELMEILKNGTHNTNHSHNTTTTNSHNKAFNLHFFLNETCKNAMNLSDFVDSIKVDLLDIERFGEVGYVEGISNIITSNLKVLDVTERPVHCTDKKRETIYVKDQDKWEKEDDNKTKLRNLIKRIETKNFKLLPSYREKYPGCQSSASRFSDKYNKMMVEIMGGPGDDDKDKQDKIIHLLSKSIVVDK